MTPTTYQPAPMAAYVSLNAEGDALYRFSDFGLLSISDARFLATKGWIEPDFVRITTSNGRKILFEFASLSLSGSIIRNEMMNWVSEGDFEWGATWNTRETVMGRHSPPDEPKMVHSRGFLRLMDEGNIDLCYDQSANDWWQGDLASRTVEDITLPLQ
ncbi:MAG: hypothetical protein ABJN52_14520 [Litorimonas sp.]